MKGARLVIMVTSLTLKAPHVIGGLEDVVKKGQDHVLEGYVDCQEVV